MPTRTATVADQIPATAGSSSSASTDASRLVHSESLYSVVDVSNNSTTVYTGACMLTGICVTTALSAHACPIQDASTVIASIVASAAIGTLMTFPGIRCDTSLVVNPDDAGTGIIVVYYRPL